MSDGLTDRYVAFDVETPNRKNDRISSIGLVVIEGGRIVRRCGMLIDPQEPFDWFNARLTGISTKSVQGKPTFPDAWERLEPILSDAILVAHNARFDLGVLDRCLGTYGISWKPSVSYVCTVRMGRRILPKESHKLDADCERFGIALDHHKASSDSQACAEIFLRYVTDGADVSEYVRTYELGKHVGGQGDGTQGTLF